MVSQCTTMTSMHHHDFMEDAQLVEYLRPVGLQENAICPLPLSSRMTSLSGADFAEPSLPDGALPGHAKSNHWKPTVATSGRRTSFISGRVSSAGELHQRASRPTGKLSSSKLWFGGGAGCHGVGHRGLVHYCLIRVRVGLPHRFPPSPSASPAINSSITHETTLCIAASR